MSYTLQTHPARIETSLAGTNLSLATSMHRTSHLPFILLAGITGTAHTGGAALDPFTTVLTQATYDALAVKPAICSLPRSGLLLELSLVIKTDKDLSTGVTTAPVVRVFGVLPAPTGPVRRLGNVKQIEANSWSATPAAPFNLATFIPLMSVTPAPSAAITMPTTNAISFSDGANRWFKTEPLQVYLAGSDSIVALLETSAIIDRDSVATCHLEARVIDA